VSSWEEGRRLEESAHAERERYRNPFKRPRLKRCSRCGTEFFEKASNECCPKCGNSAVAPRGPAQKSLAFVMITTVSSSEDERGVLAQLREVKNVKEAYSVFDVCQPGNIAAIVESETYDELKTAICFKLGQIAGIRSTLTKFVSSREEAERLLEAARFPRKSGKPVFR